MSLLYDILAQPLTIEYTNTVSPLANLPKISYSVLGPFLMFNDAVVTYFTNTGFGSSGFGSSGFGLSGFGLSWFISLSMLSFILVYNNLLPNSFKLIPSEE